MLPTLLLTLALAEEPRCPAGTKLVKRDQVEQCVTPQGKIHGLVRVKSDSGKVILEQQWVNDQLDGPGHTWHDNGKMESETFYKAGAPDGAWKEWWPSGVLAGESQYRAGERVGTWTLYYQSGKPAWQRAYGPGGKLKSEATFSDGGKKDAKELSPSVVARVMHGARPALRLCYEAELPANPNLKGSMRVDFEVGPSGAVQGAKLQESSVKNANVEQCVLRNLAKVEFPRPPGGEAVPVSFPFTFKGQAPPDLAE